MKTNKLEEMSLEEFKNKNVPFGTPVEIYGYGMRFMGYFKGIEKAKENQTMSHFKYSTYICDDNFSNEHWCYAEGIKKIKILND